MSLLVYLYLGLTAAFPGLLLRRALRAHASQGADPLRISERHGQATLPRPRGRLVWLHAASVGEFIAIRDLAMDICHALPAATVLVTTMTKTGADAVDRMGGDRIIHQYLPADTPAAVTAFLEHWRPDLVAFTESDLWPRLIRQTARRDIPMALVNVRPSRSRKRTPRSTATLMSAFGWITTQTDAVAQELASIGVDPDRIVATGDLKADATPLPDDPVARDRMAKALQGRPIWIAASTHPSDEVPVLAAQKTALIKIPDLLLVLVPRHPDRAPEIQRMAAEAGLTLARRSENRTITAATRIYLADTLGETGLFYRLAPLVFLGGSFGQEGGHNPYEPARLGVAVLHGPNVRHFDAAYRDMDAAGAARAVSDGDSLAKTVTGLLGRPELGDMQRAAALFMQGHTGARARTLALVLALLPSGD